MNLKEAFRYQNYLDELISSINAMLMNTSNVTTVTEQHYPSRVCYEADDFVRDASTIRPFECSVQSLVVILLRLFGEKKSLSLAIDKAKMCIMTSIDAEIQINRVRRLIAKTLNHMSRTRSCETEFTASGHRFNAEGNQIMYSYPAVRTTSPDFDRAEVRSLSHALFAEADAASSTVDAAMVNTEVDYIPIFSPNDSLDDIIGLLTGNDEDRSA